MPGANAMVGLAPVVMPQDGSPALADPLDGPPAPEGAQPVWTDAPGHRDGALVIHMGAVRHGKRALVLLGSSRTGNSTLAAPGQTATRPVAQSVALGLTERARAAARRRRAAEVAARVPTVEPALSRRHDRLPEVVARLRRPVEETAL